MNLEQEIRMLKEQVRALSQRIEQRPVVQTVKMPSQMYVIIDKGNTLDGGVGVDGIKHLTTEIASLPSAYDPNVTSTFIDGIGRGTLVKDGLIVSGYVLVCNDKRSLWAHSLLKDDGAAVSGTASIPNGSGSSLVYIPV